MWHWLRHTWSKWEIKDFNVTVYNQLKPEGVTGVRQMQERKCLECGFVQRKALPGGQ